MRQQRAVIIGGSIGGLFVANLLARAGWQVELYDRVADDLAGRGAGIGTHDELFNVMRALGIAIDDSIGVQVSERVCLASSGEVVHRLAWRPCDDALGAHLPAAPRARPAREPSPGPRVRRLQRRRR
ncbi:MAG: FAD-dependent monooxygenase [Burkholderiales bacterium]